MNRINVLVLSSGRRVELVEQFKKAGKALGINCEIIAGDNSELAPALYYADKSIITPRIDEPNYISFLIEVSKKENISLIVPTIDTDLLLLAKNKEWIEKSAGVKVLISDYNVIDICRDKFNTHNFLLSNGFKVPKMYSEVEINDKVYPLFIKPKSGSSSINTFKVSSEKELKNYKPMIDEPIIQECLAGDEYTVDVFLDFESNVISIVPRLRIATRSGEISKGKIVKDQDIIRDVHSLMKTLKPIGHITVQLFKTKDGIKYIEINPRFGGGAPMSIQSGADSCEYLFKLLSGQELKYTEDYKNGMIFLRFDRSIALDENLNIYND
ncbi:ATP-grasp domain-containing protein [Alkalibacillus salilacus]|uniref:Carbamoyl-phosphate synthase large subunit n=1 Tax=Alkalibacillus salilacus TaxID=284582 RepID=A0ABT9VI06_9BACI|nr:ATP-grasp domain-containing protein [Alkalibacillus salilacus]MDQ0160549.1 carbamoyl-phosphate synthase large subunit [Alkalibacillus salilacus]